jgi:hypothetical protein
MQVNLRKGRWRVTSEQGPIQRGLKFAIAQKNVRFWPKADMRELLINVRSWGNSGHFWHQSGHSGFTGRELPFHVR